MLLPGAGRGQPCGKYCAENVIMMASLDTVVLSIIVSIFRSEAE
jgi:hypothetical protein